MSTTVQLPHWDMTVVYSSLESPEFRRDFLSIPSEIAALEELLDQFGVGPRSEYTANGSAVDAFEAIVEASEWLQSKTNTLAAYIRSFISTDSFNDVAQGKLSELQQQMVRLVQLETRITAWVGAIDLEALIGASEAARNASYFLRKTRIQAEHLMTLPEENLAAALTLSGGSAWSKLHSDMSSQLLVPIEVEDRSEQLPMSIVRNMAYEADRTVRRRAFDAEVATWQRVSTPMAAALNGIKGESNTIQARRGWESSLDYALFLTNIDSQTLDAMMEAAHASFPDFRRYFHAKARALGVPTLAWYDLFAPVGAGTREWGYEEGCAFLLDQFGAYSERLREFAERAFRENWIDAEPRSGKVGGAFCMWLRDDESRVLTNYMSTYDGVRILAHELGHAYHNFNLAGRSMMQRQTPMTLAETASIFCETIIEHAAVKRAERSEQLAILEASIQGSCQVVVDITSRFLFEKAVFDGRRTRELSVDELCDLMLEAQRETYGDGLDHSALHPYMWAAKSHYFSTGRPFYNFPYMFGLLFGLGLYARYQADADSFRASYDDLLSSTGLADAATLAARFDIDIRTPEFWHSSLDIVRVKIDCFEALIEPASPKRA